jgi:hypothetical protein
MFYSQRTTYLCDPPEFSPKSASTAKVGIRARDLGSSVYGDGEVGRDENRDRRVFPRTQTTTGAVPGCKIANSLHA